MKLRRLGLWIVIATLALLQMTGFAAAQRGVPVVAFVNASGQLVVAGAGGNLRWIVTDPGEMLHPTVGFSWSPDGERLFLAVDTGGGVSLRVGDLSRQTVQPIGDADQSLTGGSWTPDGGAVVLADSRGLFAVPIDGSGAAPITNGTSTITMASPYASTRPYVSTARSLSPDGGNLLVRAGNNAYLAFTATDIWELPGGSAPAANAGLWSGGLWSDDFSLVAYWGYADGASALYVVHAPNGAVASLESGTSIPVQPLAWQPETTRLIYQNLSSIQLAEMGCLATACEQNPLESGLDLLPTSATDVQVSGGYVFFRDGENVRALDLRCVDSGNCAGQAVTLGQRAAPQTWLHASGGTLIYTGYANNPRDAEDREVRYVDLACLESGGCQARGLLPNAVAGLVSPDGRYVVVDVIGNGLNVLDTESVTLVYLSGSMGAPGEGLATARWAGQG